MKPTARLSEQQLRVLVALQHRAEIAGMRPGSPEAKRLTGQLVQLIETERLSIAAAARTIGMPTVMAGMLVRLRAIELECAESEWEQRLDAIQAACPGEDWWKYRDRQLEMIAAGKAIPTRIVRELVEGWQERTGNSTTQLGRRLGITNEALRRSLGMSWISGRVKYGYHYPTRKQKTITTDCAARIVRAIGIPPHEVPGL